MKKVFLTLLATVALGVCSYAQKANVKSILNSIEKSDEDIQDPKKNIKASTWITRGKRFYDAAVAHSETIYVGMKEADLLTLVGTPGENGEYEGVEIDGVMYNKFIYPTASVYLSNGLVTFWEPAEVFYPGAFRKSLESYLKAVEIDPSVSKKVGKALTEVMESCVSEANCSYSLGYYTKASEYFIICGDIASTEVVNSILADQYHYFGCVAAVQAQDYVTVAPVLKALIEGGFYENGDVYYYYGQCAENIGDMAEAEKAYTSGVDAYPANEVLMNHLINFYISSGENPEKVIPYVKKAQEDDPENVNLIFVEGITYQNIKDFPNAHAAYERVKALMPDFFDVYFNDGLAYVAESDGLVSVLNEIDYSNKKLYDETLAEISGLLIKASENFEKANVITPNDRNIVELLKSIYFRLRDVDDKYLTLYDKYNEQLQTL